MLNNKTSFSQSEMDEIRRVIRDKIHAPETACLQEMVASSSLEKEDRIAIQERAKRLVKDIRRKSKTTMMENFLGEYGLSTREGIALMCLAEALLRVPDEVTIDALIEDKIIPGAWEEHLGQSPSSLVNASTWALMMTGKVIDSRADDPAPSSGSLQFFGSALRDLIRRIGEPMVRTAVEHAMKEMGRQFVLGRNMEEAIKRAEILEAQGYSYSYDMLGEAARTDEDARRFHIDYGKSITAIAGVCKSKDFRKNPSISVKLSALHPRYEYAKRERVMEELVARAHSLALLAKSAYIGFNIDSEEADRLDLSLDVVERILSDPALAGWNGFGVVIQAYGKRAINILDWLYNLAVKYDRKIMVRLVKGAYWDTEIKNAQVLGLPDYPVFTRKNNTDVSYLCCADRLLQKTDRIYPQFATHNAHSVSAIQYLAERHGVPNTAYEFQCLHGMGEALHERVMSQTRGSHSPGNCRIYAPVGAHSDLLAYLVRRLLENGANSSFVNQIVDKAITPEEIAKDPFTILEETLATNGKLADNPRIPKPHAIFGEGRLNAKGWDLCNPHKLFPLLEARDQYKETQWEAKPLIDAPLSNQKSEELFNPAVPEDKIGASIITSPEDLENAFQAAEKAFESWTRRPAKERAELLLRTAEVFEENSEEFFAILAREAGKSLVDAVGEVRESVDFCRYYANEALKLENEADKTQARGVIGCISPWNFPLAIFSGQILASIAAGNVVLAKPAGQTPLIAAKAVELMYQAGIPRGVVQLVPGGGGTVGQALISDPRIQGICFTGSTATAQKINRAMAEKLAPDAPLVAETGGINAMLVDSTALPEQAIKDIISAAFQSAGQRCSALRMLYVQKDVKDKILNMLYGAMDELSLGNPWHDATDIGPVIDKAACDVIEQHCAKFEKADKIVKRLEKPESGFFVPPTVVEINSIAELKEEIFGPVLHVATYEAKDMLKVADDINAKGFGLTFGFHSRVESRIQEIIKNIKVGNLYINQTQIGAVVGSQPFGGEGLSGTGPKAGGPYYLSRFRKAIAAARETKTEALDPIEVPAAEINDAFNALEEKASFTAVLPAASQTSVASVVKDFNPALYEKIAGLDLGPKKMPGPTGEANELSHYPRGRVLLIDGQNDASLEQLATSLAVNNPTVVLTSRQSECLKALVAAGLPIIVLQGATLSHGDLGEIEGLALLAAEGGDEKLRGLRQALAQRDGALVPLITDANVERFILERHICIDTTAAGGNTELMATASKA